MGTHGDLGALGVELYKGDQLPFHHKAVNIFDGKIGIQGYGGQVFYLSSRYSYGDSYWV